MARVALLLVLIAAFPEALRIGRLLPDGATWSFLTTGGALAGAALPVLLTVRPLRRAVRSFLAVALGEARTVHTRPARVLALWGGSLAFRVLQAAGLVAVGRSLHLALPVAHVAIAHLAAGVVAAAVPTPGGIGSVDAALALALITIGAPAASATAAVLAFRLITVRLPLIPGALMLGALVRWKVM